LNQPGAIVTVFQTLLEKPDWRLDFIIPWDTLSVTTKAFQPVRGAGQKNVVVAAAELTKLVPNNGRSPDLELWR